MRIKKQTKLILKIALLFLICVICFEFLLSLYYKNLYQHSISPTELFKQKMLRNESATCDLIDTISINPYFVTSYSRNDFCSSLHKNNYGYNGRDIPIKKDLNYYTILMLGASGAEQIGGFNYNIEENVLENKLNSQWISPNGKPFRLVNASMPSAHFPTALIQTAFFTPVVDEIILYEGYNNLSYIDGHGLIESDIQDWAELATAQDYPVAHLFNYILRYIKHRILSSPLQKSYISFWVIDMLKDFQSAQTKPQTSLPLPNVPLEWTPQQKIDFFNERYSYFASVTNNIAKVNDVKFTIFIQPSPFFFKKLTQEELNLTRNISYYPKYKEVINLMLQLKTHGLHVENLEKIFSNEINSTYIDQIHLNELGIDIASQEIAKRISLRNHWIKK